MGGGSYGIVARVWKANRYYAMKVYSDQYLQEKGHSYCLAVELFQRETALLQRIRHPSVPSHIDSFACEKMYFLVQDYIPGNTLAALINQGYCFREEEVKKLLLSLLHILCFLHKPQNTKPGLVHRDLRLSNIMISEGELFIIDFGLAYPTQNSAGESVSIKRPPLKSAADVSTSYLKMRNDFSEQNDLFGAGVVAVDLFSNTAGEDDSLPWEERIFVSSAFKAFIRRLLGVEGKFASCREAVEHLQSLQ